MIENCTFLFPLIIDGLSCQYDVYHSFLELKLFAFTGQNANILDLLQYKTNRHIREAGNENKKEVCHCNKLHLMWRKCKIKLGGYALKFIC